MSGSAFAVTHHPVSSCTTREIADATGISAYQARYYLMTLDREKKIRRTPLRQGARTLWGVLREK
ncbi:hypothetical protein C1098_004695 [Escherichia coli O157]|nr:hypothetical protein [Escherichia coli O157]